jgi:hypothetical protein
MVFEDFFFFFIHQKKTQGKSQKGKTKKKK